MTEVGVSLALRQQQNNLLRPKRESISKKRDVLAAPSQTTSEVKSKVKRKRGDGKPKNSSWQIFVEGAALYTSCLVVPSVIGSLLRWSRRFWEINGVLHPVTVQICSLPWIIGFQWCIRNSSDASSASSSLTKALAPDAGISDVALVGLLSMFLAIIRLGLVHFLVPNYNQPKRLEALVRCKSVHLLSSQYPGTVTPQGSVSGQKIVNLARSEGLPPLPSLGLRRAEKPPRVPANIALKTDSYQLSGSRNNENSLDDDNSGYDLGGGYSFNLENEDDYDDDDNDLATAPAVSSGLMTSSSALSLQNLLHQATPMVPQTRRESMMRSLNASTDEPDRIFAAPKYATAVFRMVYSSASCIIALFYFLDADFWPPALGGSGSTKNCWDLSSIGATVMDSDFDQHNTVLRRYYLLQASYHFHSAAFHVLAAALLWLVSSASKNKSPPPEKRPKYFGLIPEGMMTIQNVHSLFQHCFSLGLIAFTYLFSSLRRLGVIAMFAFDFSSWFLHLLQMCINAPYGTRKISPRWIRILHTWLVIPAFCYSRFYIFPFVIGYSSLEESQDWLRQLENMLVPGTASYFHGTFVVSFVLIVVMNFVYARRLINHPHVKHALSRSTK